MANTESQAEAIRDLLVERLELFDPTLDVSEGSALWSQVIEPVFEQLGTDPFDTDIRAFLKDRVTQSLPTVSASDGDALVDLLITPLEVLLEPLKREIQIIRRGQSARDSDTMRLEDARDLAANFFVEWRGGSRATGSVRVYFAVPTYVTILPTVEFSTASGLIFNPLRPVTVRPEQMLLYRSGQDYYVDVSVTSAETGASNNIGKGEITSARGISGYTRVSNLSGFEGAEDAETVDELLARTRASLTERTLNVRRGIVARIEEDFASVIDVEVVGYGDPEMNRDVVTGGGEGSVVASGVCIVVGQFVLMFSMFEDRGADGSSAVSEGDEIELNFWSFLYSTETGAANEKFTIDTILFDSRASIPQLPSILLFRISGVPSVTQPVAGTLAGVLPGVFAVVRGTGKIEISDIPGGILNPDTLRGTIEVNDGEVHIGGHYDVWLRASSATEDAATLDSLRSESALLEGSDLVVNGESAAHTHLVHRAYTVTSTTQFTLDTALSVEATGAEAVISRVTASGSSRTYELWEMNGVEFAVGDVLVAEDGTTGTVTAVSSQDWEDAGVKAGMVLSLPRGNEEGTYRVLKVEGPFLYVDIALTTTAKDQIFRIIDAVSIDLFDPKSVLVPFGDAAGDDLRTTIGSTVLRTTINLQDYGVETGDTLEILDGDDIGAYTIQSWDTTYGGNGPVVNTSMTATNSSVSYKVYRTGQAAQRPFLRVKPGGVVLLDASGQDSGYRVPYALPVDVRAKDAFSGSKAVAAGLNGFVLMDPGSGWAPAEDYTVDIATFDWTTWTGGDFEDFYTEEKFRRCYTDECITSSGYVAVISVHGSNGQMYLESNLPSAAQDFLTSLREWLLSIISTFNFGGDEEELVNAFSPLQFGPNTDTALPLLLQFEIIIPFEVFDGCNNVFVALPEFDWKNEFEDAETFNEAIGRFNDGEMSGKAPALLKARAGDTLTVLSGLNAGAYVVDSVQEYVLINGGAVVEGGSGINLDDAYRVALVVIRDEFPVPAFNGLQEFFSSGSATWSLPSVPALPFTVTDDTGNPVSGWDWVETTLTWVFQVFSSLGFDLPESITLDVPETLKVFWQLLFNDYVVGRPTSPQYARMYFQEPTSCTVYAPRVCERYQWALPDHEVISITGEDFTLPLAELDGMSFELELEMLSGDVVLSGALGADAATAATVEDLAALLQAALDPDGEHVVFSGPATATGALTITTVVGGVDTFLHVTASDLEDGFRWLGFYDSAGMQWAEVESTGAPSYLATHVALDPGTTAGFRLVFTTSAGTFSSDINVSFGLDAGDYTFIDLAPILQEKVFDAIDFWSQITDLEVSVEWDADTSAFTMSVTGTEITSTQIEAPSGLTVDLMLVLFGTAGPLAGVQDGTVWSFALLTPSPFEIFDLESTVVSGDTYTLATALTYSEAIAFDDVIDTAIGGDYDALAVMLNTTATAHSDGTERRVWFVGGTTLTVRTVVGTSSTSLELETGSTDDGYRLLGFPLPAVNVVYVGTDTSNTIAQGTTTPGDTVTAYHHARSPTLFTAAAGAAEILFTPSDEADAYQVFPGQTEGGDTAVTDLPRDVVVGTAYDGQLAAELAFTDTSYAAPLVLNIREESDVLHVHEQRVLLEFTSFDASDEDLTDDRVVAVFTTFGSAVVEIPDFTAEGGTNEFTFLAPNSGLDDDQVQVGDVLFLEEGDDAGGYTVTERTATTLTLDRALTTTTERVYRYGNDGVLVVDGTDAKFTSATAAFTSDDIGRYLTLWACNREGEDGSYEITAVESDGSGCTLDTDVFVLAESDVHWAVVKAPAETIDDSATGGRTALHGLRPVRIYSGTAGEFRVVRVTPELGRTSARVYVALDDEGTPPRAGVRQPYKVTRPGTQHISSTRMNEQRERGLFYFDVLAQSLGGDDLYNVPKDTKLEPVFGTYDSDGYRLEVSDNRYTFSTQEESLLVLSPSFLPNGLDDQLSNLVVLDSRGVRVDYEYVPVVAQVQGVLSSETERVLCANALARHFLPSYVYFDLTYSGGNAPATIAEALRDHLDGLSAVDEIDVSKLEKVLHQNAVTRYDHPVRVITLTHDLDRRIVGTQAENVISDDDIAYNGTNRTTFFIAGADASSYETEEDVPVGERTRLTQTTTRATFR